MRRIAPKALDSDAIAIFSPHQALEGARIHFKSQNPCDSSNLSSVTPIVHLAFFPTHGIGSPRTPRDLPDSLVNARYERSSAPGTPYIQEGSNISSLWSSDEYRVALASEWFGPIYMIDSERVVSAGGEIGEYVICNLLLVERNGGKSIGGNFVGTHHHSSKLALNKLTFE